jgi:tripartite-type tricarboxylate transporter receptor subunit TctC
MFGSKKTNLTPLVMGQEKFDTLIGRNAEIHGCLKLQESVRIDGKVVGNIEAPKDGAISVVIGPTGEVHGDVMASRIDFTFYTMSGLKEQVTAKRVKPLAITSARRHPDFADVPTMSEAGIAGFDHVGAWFGVVAPAATPAAVVSRLNRAIDQVLNKPEARERIAKMGMIPVGGSSESFKQFLASDSQRWTELIRAANIKE